MTDCFYERIKYRVSEMTLESTSFVSRMKENPDLSFYVLYTVLYVFMIGLTNVVNGFVGNNYGWYDVHFYWENTNFIFNGMWPYQDFKTAYPPFSLAIYLIPYLITPTDDTFMYGFTVFTYLFTILAIHGSLKFCDWKGLDHKYVYLTFLLLIVGVNNFFIGRNDTITTVFVILSLLFYWKEKYSVAFILMALGAMTKIYPVFLIPVLLIPFLVDKNWKSFFKYTLISAIVCLVIELPFLINDPATAFSYLTQHSGRGFEIESIVAIPLMIVGLFDSSLVYVRMDESWDLFGPLPEAVSPYIMPMTMAILLIFMLYFLFKLWKIDVDLEKKLALTTLACATTLMLFMAFNKVFCVQYVMWVIMMYPLIIYSFKVFGLEYKKLWYLLIAMTATTLLTVAMMGGSTAELTIQLVIADILKGVSVFALVFYLLIRIKQCFDSCKE